MVGCTIAPEQENDASIANILNMVMDSKIAISVAPRAKSIALHAMAMDKYVATFNFLLHGKPTQRSILLKGWTCLPT